MSILRSLLSLTAVASIGSALAACSSDGGATPGTGGSTTTTTSGTTTTATGGSTPATPSFVAHFDPAKGQLPEGLFIDQGEAYVGYAALGQIVKVDLAGGAVHDFGSIPPIPMNGGYMLGIVVDAQGNLFVGFGGGTGAALANGIYKIPAAGGAVTTPFATDPAMNFPNGLVLDAAGKLFVADSGGTIFAVASDGTATKWAADPSLAGTDQSCAHAAPFPLGANGIVILGGAFYVSNTNLGSIVKIPIQADGTAGTPAVVAGPDCNALGGIDGIAVDTDGKSLLAVLNSQNRLVRIDAQGKPTTVFEGAPLDNPASIALAKSGATTSAYLTNSAFFDMKTPAPGLLALPLP